MMASISKTKNGKLKIFKQGSFVYLTELEVEKVYKTMFGEEPHDGLSCPHCGTTELLCGHNGVGCSSEK